MPCLLPVSHGEGGAPTCGSQRTTGSRTPTTPTRARTAPPGGARPFRHYKQARPHAARPSPFGGTREGGGSMTSMPRWTQTRGLMGLATRETPRWLSRGCPARPVGSRPPLKRPCSRRPVENFKIRTLFAHRARSGLAGEASCQWGRATPAHLLGEPC